MQGGFFGVLFLHSGDIFFRGGLLPGMSSSGCPRRSPLRGDEGRGFCPKRKLRLAHASPGEKQPAKPVLFSPVLGCREAGEAHARVGLAVLGMRLEDAFRGGRCLVKAARLVCTSWDVRTLLCAHSCSAEGLAVRLL